MASRYLLLVLTLSGGCIAAADEAANSSRNVTANWSCASAFWFLFTLAIACLAHPRGSLLFHRTGRLWRFSPIYLLVENFVVVTRLALGIRKNGRRTWRKTMKLCAYVLLALREGNAWGQEEWNDFFGNEKNERYLKIDDREEDDGAALLPLTSTTGIDGGGNGIPLDSVVRRTTLMPEESPIEGNNNTDAEVSMNLWFELGKSTLPNEKLLARDGPLKHLLNARSRRNLEQVQDYEKGPTYRALLWLPIIQQFCKSCLVKGAPWTIFVGWIFLVSFMIVEILLIAAGSPLTEQEIVKAVELMRMWGEVERIPVPDLKTATEAKGSRLWLRSKSLKIAASCSNVVVTVLNCTIFMMIISFKSFCSSRLDYFRGGYRQLEGSGWILLILAPIYTWQFFVEMYFLFCFYVFGLAWPFVFAHGLDESSEVITKSPTDKWSYFVPHRLPAWSAGWTVVLTVIVYFGLGSKNGLVYDCSTTWKSEAYDLLG